MIIVGLLQKTLVPLSAVGGTWGCGHIIGVFLSSSISLLECFFGVLIEAHAWKNNDFVEDKSAENQKNEAGDSLPLEFFEAKQYATDPDEDST